MPDAAVTHPVEAAHANAVQQATPTNVVAEQAAFVAQLERQGALVAPGVERVPAAPAQDQYLGSQHAAGQDPDLKYPGRDIQHGVTVFLFGGVGTWKTSWAGLWPKPVFLSVGPEGGDDALAMLPSLYNMPIPPCYHITSPEQMLRKVDYLVSYYKQLDFNTVVIDSITYYVDMWIAQLLEQNYSGKKEPVMTMRDWGLLAAHIRDLAMKLHNTKLNVIWTALENEVKAQDGQGGTHVVGVNPYIKGETAVKLPGMCKMIIHAKKELTPDPSSPGRWFTYPVYYTAPNSMCKMMRHKYGNAFPTGTITDAETRLPTFQAIWQGISSFVYHT